MDKKINLNHTVYEICMEYPEVTDILKEMGFHDIVKPGMMQTAGRFMTIPKGASIKKISLDLIKNALQERGFRIEE